MVNEPARIAAQLERLRKWFASTPLGVEEWRSLLNAVAPQAADPASSAVQRGREGMLEQLYDREGITLLSNIPFEFVCCDCGLAHRMVIVSEDGKPVGFAVERTGTFTAGELDALNAASEPPTAQPAGHEDDIEAVIACLGDDAASLRDENPECEMAANMDVAAATIRSLCKQLDAVRQPASSAWNGADNASSRSDKSSESLPGDQK